MFDLFLLALIGTIIGGAMLGFVFAFCDHELAALVSMAVMGLAMAAFGAITTGFEAWALWTAWPNNAWFWIDGIAMIIIGAIMAVIGAATAWQIGRDLLWLTD